MRAFRSFGVASWRRGLHFLPFLAFSACMLGGLHFPSVPTGLAPVPTAEVMRWVAGTRIEGSRPTRIAFSWKLTDQNQDSYNGTGMVRIAQLDSLRLDFKCPLGMCRGAAFVLGDSVIWAVSKPKIETFVPNLPLFWILFGQARPPSIGAEVRGVANDQITSWRYLSGADTVTYIMRRQGQREFAVDVVIDGKPVGRALTTFGADGQLVKATLQVPSAGSTLVLTFTEVTRPDSIAAELWRAPVDSL